MEIPVPFTFNYLKHHLGMVREACRGAINNPPFQRILFNEINKIGSNLLDIYTGHLSIQQIIHEVTDQLKSQDAYTYDQLLSLLRGHDYVTLKLSDGSRWIIRLGDNVGRYIHIHPGRAGKWVTRFHSNAWKTALAIVAMNITINTDNAPLNAINDVRVYQLNLSPVKGVDKNSRIIKAYRLLKEADTGP